MWLRFLLFVAALLLPESPGRGAKEGAVAEVADVGLWPLACVWQPLLWPVDGGEGAEDLVADDLRVGLVIGVFGENL